MKIDYDVHPVEPEALIWLFRIIGALAGSAISLAYFLPQLKRDAFMRLVVGMVSGLVFGRAAGHYLSRLVGVHDDISRLEINLTGAAIVSLMAWWVLGIIKRFVRSKGVELYPEEGDDAPRR